VEADTYLRSVHEADLEGAQTGDLRVSIKPCEPSDEELARRKAARNAYKNKWLREWEKANPEKAKARRKKHYDKHAEKLRAISLTWYHNNKERAAARERVRRLRKYGLTPEQYAALGKTCHICGTEKDTRKGFQLAVDHDHETGKVRGLLCSSCNCGIGYFKHDERLLAAAIEYLKRFTFGPDSRVRHRNCEEPGSYAAPRVSEATT
jgi:hypothetical protein